MTGFREAMAALPLVAILRGMKPEEAEAIGAALTSEGFRLIEVPLNSPDPLRSIEMLAERFGDAAVIGAGTVMSADQVRELTARERVPRDRGQSEHDLTRGGDRHQHHRPWMADDLRLERAAQGDQVVGQAVGKVLLLRIVAQIVEGQDCDGRAFRQRAERVGGQADPGSNP